MRLLSVLFCSLTLLRAQVPAPSSDAAQVDPQKAALIRQIVEGTDADQLRKHIVNVLVRRQVATARQNLAYPPGYADELEKKLEESVGSIDPVELMIPTYAEHFSIEELQQIAAFRTSPVGRKLAGAQREITSEIAARAASSVQHLSIEANNQIGVEHPEYAKQISDVQARQGVSNAGNRPADAASGDQEPYRIGGDVNAPLLIQKTEPQYSPAALQAKVSGSVLLSLVVDKNGIPRDIRVIRPLGSGLDEKAVEAVTKWRFKPGTKGGEPVATTARVEVSFRLLKNPPQ
jgi:TonB family protein